MASLDYRLNPIYTIKECSSCGALYNKSCGCSKGGFVDKFVRDPNKTPDSSQRPPHNCPKCGNPVDGLYCRQCALLRKKLKEVWSTICYEDEIFQDFLNTSESSNDKTNVVNAPQEPFVFNQDPGENSSQSPPHIDHHCCYGCGDSLDGIFCQRCTCESCGNGAHYGYNCPPKVPTISNPEPCHNQNVDEFPQTLPSFHPTCYSGDENSFTYDSNLNFVDDSPNPPPQPPTYSCEFCGNDAHYGYDCPPQVPFIYNPEPCYNQDFNFPQNLQSFQQQYICCTRCGGPHETFQCQQLIFDEPYCENCGGPHMSFQCQPMNQNYYESNPCYDSNSFGFDQIQPPQYSIDRSPNKEIIESLQSMFEEFRKRQPAANIDQLPPQEMSIQDMKDLKQQYLDEMKSLINEIQIKDYRNEKIDIQYRRECEIKIDELKQNFNGMSIEIRKKEKELLQQEHATYVRTSQRFNFIDDDDDDEYSFATQEYPKKFSSAITPDLPKSDSLIMEDKHLDTIPATESDELINSSVKDLVHTPSESDGISESEYDLPVYDDSSPKKDEVLNDIISILPGNGNDHFNAESSPIESVLNHDNVISYPKIDLLIEEFASELALIAPIPSRIVKADLDPKGDIRFIENLMYDNSFPRPPETLKDDSETVIDYGAAAGDL
ncbi:hypothetical protein Tco_1032503 [Tanacetum coccineum]|uniref:CCHC-type domain-containing protein n=1 Tax=Tanacetum coccineum TaxID=301880 RepID=A0ABQ5GC04_9ASTR